MTTRESRGTPLAATCRALLDWRARCHDAARGKASLGDKTVLDALDAAARAADGVAPEAMFGAVAEGVRAVLGRMRGEAAKVGRARIFAERSAGMDDPGMVALSTMVEGLRDRAAR